MKKYKINEIFYSTQGEGVWTGTPMIFIRFAGCNLKCDFCDTQHETYQEMSAADILAAINWMPAERVCLTGGEPSLQIDANLIEHLKAQKRIIHIETNGLSPIPSGIDWITVSPKTPRIRAIRADELKIVYQGQDVSTWECFEATHHYLQPCSCQNTDEVLTFIKHNPKWRISIQTQKLLNFQ